MTTITTTVHALRELVAPVLPLAGNDYNMPVLTAVMIESRGKWLTAAATDRFRLGMKRIPAPDGEEWPEFKALVSARALKSILATFKGGRGENPEITLTVDGARITVEASAGLVDDIAGARATYHLTEGDFPNLDKLIATQLAAEAKPIDTGFNFKLLAGFQAATTAYNAPLQIRSTGDKSPLLILGEDFVGCLMPRRLHSGEAPWGSQDWADTLRADAADSKEKVA